MASNQITLCVDLGKTSCRVALLDGTRTLAESADEGLTGASALGAVPTITDRIATLAARLAVGSAHRPVGVGAGVAGTLTAPEAARSIAESLAAAVSLPVAVSSDIVTAHIGALGGGPGVVLVAGTGAVAFGVDEDGTLRVVDGWGPELGDLGSGTWIGREGVRATLRAGVGLAAPTALTDALQHFTRGVDPVRWLAAATSPGATVARFAPAVLDAAAAGDPAASDITGRALAHLAETATAAAPPAGSAAVAVLGGLTGHQWFAEQVIASLTARGLQPVAPAGTALDGAWHMASRTDFPHERYVHRAE
jgi:glucosamine kinase